MIRIFTILILFITTITLILTLKYSDKTTEEKQELYTLDELMVVYTKAYMQGKLNEALYPVGGQNKFKSDSVELRRLVQALNR